MGLFLLSFLFFSCQQNTEQLPTDMVNIPATAGEGINKKDLPEMKFDETLFDFGTITQGEKVSHTFRFENTGRKNLIISNASADCGCTVPEFSKKPVPPGESGIIKVTFDSYGKSGIITKQITFLTNCIPNTQILKIKADIFVPKTK